MNKIISEIIRIGAPYIIGVIALIGFFEIYWFFIKLQNNFGFNKGSVFSYLSLIISIILVIAILIMVFILYVKLYTKYTRKKLFKNLSPERKREIEEEKRIYSEIKNFVDKKYKKGNFRIIDSTSNKNCYEVIFRNSKNHRMIKVYLDRKNKQIKECTYTEAERERRKKEYREIIEKTSEYMVGHSNLETVCAEEDENEYVIICNDSNNSRELEVSFNKKTGEIKKSYV